MLLRNAELVDGTGAPSRKADVLVKDGRIVAIESPGGISAPAEESVDLSGLVLAPGFIDPHTHFDAQICWDRDLTPTCWHGVTTVMMGNCGFGIAPTRPEHREIITRTLENVEGMTYKTLKAGVGWDFETFPEYLDFVESQPTRLNVACYLGHTPLRLYVMGEDAMSRAATPEEIAKMVELTEEAAAAGASGVATSMIPVHFGIDGKPVPTRFAQFEEFAALADVFGRAGRGVVMTTLGMPDEQTVKLANDTKRPVTWGALMATVREPGVAQATLERLRTGDAQVWPQIACRPVVFQITLEDPYNLIGYPGFDEVMSLPRQERHRLYADKQWRDRVRGPMMEGMMTGLMNWGKWTIDESEAHPDLVRGPTIAEIAAARQTDPLDMFFDLALQDGLKTRFKVIFVNDDEDEVGRLLQDPRTLLGLSDAGAHASQLCDACYSTYLLSYWVRDKKVLTIEQAVWRLTGQPAQVLGLKDRGTVRVGAVADLVAFDAARVGPEAPQRVQDQPGGQDRILVRSKGIEHVWVNGQAIRRDGKDLDCRPGRLLRGGVEALATN